MDLCVQIKRIFFEEEKRDISHFAGKSISFKLCGFTKIIVVGLMIHKNQ